MNKFITEELLKTIPDLYETESVENPICHVKLFTPDHNWTWYIIEISKDNNNLCFGYVQGLDSELGYFSLEEISSVRGSLGLTVEKDMFFTSKALSEIKEGE